MIEGGWNPYFVAFAHAHGCTPEAMVRGPRIAARYLTWIPGESCSRVGGGAVSDGERI